MNIKRLLWLIAFLAATTFGQQSISEVDLAIPVVPGFKGFFFRNYYVSPSTGRDGYVSPAPFGQLHSSEVVRGPNGTYLIVTAYGLGDVWQLDGTPGPPPPPVPPTPPVTPPITPPVPPPPPQQGCPLMRPGINVFIGYNGSASGCSQNFGACNAGEMLTFRANAFQYDFACAPHTFRWSFGDGSPASTQQVVQHAFSVGRDYQVTLTIANATQGAVVTTQTVRVTGEGLLPPQPPQPPQPPVQPPVVQPCPIIEPCPPVPPCPACPVCPTFPPTQPPVQPPVVQPPVVQPPQPPSGACTIVPFDPTTNSPANGNLFIFFASDTCSSSSTDACDAGELIQFGLGSRGFRRFECPDLKFQWNFGDGTSDAIMDKVESPRHRFSLAKTYRVTLTITAAGQQPVTITRMIEVQR